MAAGKPGPVVPERYVQALAGADPIESMRKAPKRIKKLIKGLSEKALARRAAPGKWSIKEAIAHMADGEIILGSRIRLVAAQERPPLQPYDQDAFVEHLGIEKRRTSELLESFARARALTVDVLERLAPEAFARIGIHGERGEESIETMVNMYAGHDLIHEAQMRTLVEARKERKARSEPSAKLEKSAKPEKSGKPEKSSKRKGRSKNDDRALAELAV